MRLDGQLNHYYRFKVDGNLLTLPGIEPHSLATVLAEVYQLLSNGWFVSSELPAVSRIILPHVVELIYSLCSDTIIVFQLNANSYCKSFYVSHSRKHVL
jgi:hypothetical protein